MVGLDIVLYHYTMSLPELIEAEKSLAEAVANATAVAKASKAAHKAAAERLARYKIGYSSIWRSFATRLQIEKQKRQKLLVNLVESGNQANKFTRATLISTCIGEKTLDEMVTLKVHKSQYVMTVQKDNVRFDSLRNGEEEENTDDEEE